MPRMTLFAASLAVAVGVLDPGGSAPESAILVDHQASQVHEHRSPGKPGAQVRLTGPSRYTLPLGEAGKLNLALQAAPEQGLLTVEVKLGDGLTLIAGEVQGQLNLAESQELVLPIEVLASVPGEHFVHLFTRIEDSFGATTSRALAVPVLAGEVGESHHYKSTVPTKSAAEWIKLPVSETIR